MTVPTRVVFPHHGTGLLAYVEKETGQRVMRCYQCGKCTGGCPLASTMDFTPRQVLRAIQLGLEDFVLQTSAPHLCISCHTCSVRCPAQIDIPKVMESLVHRASQRGFLSPQGEVALFQRLFLKVIERRGRTHELGLGSLYNLLSGHLLDNVTLLPQLMRRGKLPLLPEPAGKGEMRRIFSRVVARDGRDFASAGRAWPEVAATKLVAAAGALPDAVVGLWSIFRRRRHSR